MKTLREPLLHFLLIGALIFAAHAFLTREASPRRDAIVVTRGRIDSLVAQFTATRGRPPSDAERDGMIQGYVREEIFCREAVALGLDQEDAVIRDRLRQKMEFVSADTGAQAEPGVAELQAYLEAHPEEFRAADGHLPTLAEAREAVATAWADARRLEANDRLYEKISRRYRVTIEPPAAAGDAGR